MCTPPFEWVEDARQGLEPDRTSLPIEDVGDVSAHAHGCRHELSPLKKDLTVGKPADVSLHAVHGDLV